MKRIRPRIILLLSLTMLTSTSILASTIQGYYYNVKDYGAKGNGVVYDTKAIQTAIDSAYTHGGGTVFLPSGTYLTKTLVLKNHIRLYLDNGTVLLGSTEMKEFKPQYGSFLDSGGRKFGTALIFAKNAEDIAIEGNGTINGQGFSKYYPVGQGTPRPSIIRFIDCQKVKVENVTLENSAAWVQHYVRCKDMTIRDITVNSYSNKNNDGLDLESCERVIISGCNINSEDDAIVLKALTQKPCRDIVISDCIISGLKSAIKTGTESIGDFENIAIANCVIYGTRGISLIAVDGGSINNITISNISMRNSYAVIVMRLGERMRPYSVKESERPKSAGTFRNIMINNIQAENIMASNDFISGIPGHYIEEVTLSNIRIEYAGGGKSTDSGRAIPEMIKDYPKALMFGTLPAYGLFVRHAKNIILRNISFRYRDTDERSVIKFDDVMNGEINSLKAETSENAAPFIWLNNSGDIKISNSSPLGRGRLFLKAKNSGKIILTNNELSKTMKKFDLTHMKKENIIKQINY